MNEAKEKAVLNEKGSIKGKNGQKKPPFPVAFARLEGTRRAIEERELVPLVSSRTENSR